MESKGTTITLDVVGSRLFSTSQVTPTSSAADSQRDGQERTQLANPDNLGGTTLSTAAKAVIGVGIGIFIILSSLVFIFMRRRRRRHREKSRRRSGAAAPQPNIHERRLELHSHEHRPGELASPNREYIWGPAVGKQEVVEIMPPEPLYGSDTGLHGLRPPPSPGRIKPV
ncbi:hypothetical protein B0T14DRAFT_571802 [Immersiella caudata]|uniref:Uncharacterized protein n=1 Tax=Immersiella caudata TaxID=314043 RepID=A0AA39U3Y9_9PEZI|nr:hypothetical protein B0T14DRAFT_571802 [Immersiella caudata]